MKIGITGGRYTPLTREDRDMLYDLYTETLDCEGFVLGDCPTGIDSQAKAHLDFYGIPFEIKYADWQKHGKAAGPIRNGEIIKELLPDGFLVAFKGDRGTANCIRQAERAGIKVIEAWLMKG